MLKKEHDVSMKILTLQALLRRLPKHHLKRHQVEKELARRIAGLRGEESINYELSLLQGKNEYIFQDLRLPNGEHYFQIDALLLHPNFILTIEVKNIGGTIYFDKKFNQMIRILNDQEEVFPNPILQIKRQRTHLKEFLNSHKIEDIPIESLIVFSNPYTLLKSSPEYTPQELSNIIQRAELPFKIERFKQTYNSEKLTPKDIRRLSSLLLKKHIPSPNTTLENYKINPGELLKGVHCPNCFELPMQRKLRKWYCSQCKIFSTTAHINSIFDYYLLLSETITNRKLQDFLQLPSRTSSLHLLRSMNLESIGTTKGTKYFLDFDTFSTLNRISY
ncbi:hypothetical protein JOC85_000757 [Bacillus mesophilus]|uniref:NERD domain-containing protein n=1 Tax=Bacillus mesophilus TaxID=1808955 RepID=A0A6M0Q394_9BACI|nr:nuclease-related domain-containing protein [Bacillus mesophilus]MBM7659990.1 hypothetical protein [Bacillus mesophilus]NEY70851.1 NERD domain-containing protein [Bacillus mesophilus]